MRPSEADFIQISTGAAIFYPLLFFLDDSGWFSALIPAVIVHEAGHIAALHCCGIPIRQLRLEVTGLCMECDSLFTSRQEALCAFAGPVAGLLWSLLLRYIPGCWAEISGRISLGLSLFNMLPVRPLDGGRILLALTGSERLVRLWGIIIPASLILFALWTRQWQCIIPAGILTICQIKS